MPKKKGFLRKLWDEHKEDEKKVSKLSERGYTCNSCNYRWMSKKDFGEPAKCPKCNSLNIRKVKVTFIGVGWHWD